MNAYINIIRALALLLITFGIAPQARAQLDPMGALYFQNQYLGNPSMAGSGTGLNLAMGYRQQWTSIPGSPSIQVLTADYALNEKVGLGVNVYNDKAGLFRRTRTVASYAYHLPLNGENEKLSFGVSLGFMNERLSSEEVKGDADDVNIGNYNQRDTYIDGDFGIAYTNSRISLQAALPNMKGFFKKDLAKNSVDHSTFFSALSYKMILNAETDGFSLEPKVAYRGVKGFDNILDAGANLTYANLVNFFGMYHSSRSATFGLGVNYESLNISGIYTTVTSALSGYANGNFEISVKVNLFNKKDLTAKNNPGNL